MESNKPDKEAMFQLLEKFAPRTKLNYDNDTVPVYAAFAAMESFSASQNSELKAKCESDHLSIDELLSEFSRCGFNTENWDGDEGAEKAIVKGVCTSLEERTEKIFDMMTDDHIKFTTENSKLKKENEGLKIENETFKDAMVERNYAYNRLYEDFKTLCQTNEVFREENKRYKDAYDDSQSTIEEKDSEIERLKGLIEKLFRDDRFSPELFNEDWIQEQLEKFKTENNL